MLSLEIKNTELNNSLLEIAKSIAATHKSRKTENIKVSIIIPCFNIENLIAPCLESIYRQTEPLNNIEVICVDDYSTDDSCKTILSYADKIPNLRLIKHKENKKQGAARNTGIDQAKGKYIFFLDADDYLRLDAIERLLFSAKDHDLVIGQTVYDRFDKKFKRTVSERSIEGNIRLSAISSIIGWSVWGCLIKSSIIKENNIRFREGVFYEDIDFMIRLCFSVEKPLVIKEQVHYYIRRNGSTINTINEEKLTDSMLALREVFYLAKNFSPTEYAIWIERSAKWILFQFMRIDKNLNSLKLKKQLSNFFISTLKDNRVLEKYPADFIKKINELTEGYCDNSAEEPEDNFQYKPWDSYYDQIFKGKIIFYCEVDYHIRSSVTIVRQLHKLGYEGLIIDSSNSKNFSSNRPLHKSELKKYSDINILEIDVSSSLPFSDAATAYVFMNDLTYTRQLILENFGIGIPTIGIYEGINDNWNADRVTLSRKPYRSVDTLLLPGVYETAFFTDRTTQIVGLPNIYRIWKEKAEPAHGKLIIINVNFTYGVLECSRDVFVKSAVQACKELNIPYVISQHPADKADLSQYNITKETIYELLTKGCLLISRFSTTILEALAMGRSVVYHNPINEKVPKFHNPLGAYSTSDSVETLKESILKELSIAESGVDLKTRAALFLHFHCNIFDPNDPSLLCAKAIVQSISSESKKLNFKISKTK